jgi:filamentous hemagglutinin
VTATANTANTANTINTDVKGKLSIESLQDSSQQSSSQTNVGGRVQVSFGTAWEASGSVSQNKGSGASQAVKEQSELIAGEVGYHIRADTVDLKGGAITSTNASKSDLSTNAITFQNIDNKMDYKASSVSMAGSIGGGSSNANGSSGNSIQQQNFGGAKGGNVTPGLPSQTKGNDQSTTYATLTEGNLTIAGKSTTAKELGINTDIAKANTQIATVPNIKDVLKEQQAMSAAAGTVIATSKQVAGDIANNAARTRADQQRIIDNPNSTTEQKEQAQKLVTEAKQTQADWSQGGKYNQALGVVTALTVDKTAGQGGAATANAVGAVMAKQIGDIADKNKWAEGSTEKVILHGLAGLVQAKLGDNNALAGAVVGALYEYSVPKLVTAIDNLQKDQRTDLIKQYEALSKMAEGAEKDSTKKQLDSQWVALDKENKSMIELGSAIIGGVAGKAIGGDLQTANAGANMALTADQNNRQLHLNEKQRIKELAKGDAEKEARLIMAACALVKCYAEYPENSAEYKYFKNLADISASTALAHERQLLSKQTDVRFDVKVGMVTNTLFGYSTNRINPFSDANIDAAKSWDTSMGFTTRLGGAAQVVGGVGTAVVSSGLVVSGTAACPASFGAGCGIAAVGVVGNLWSADQIVSGGKTLWNGQASTSLGGQLVSNVFGVSAQTDELINSFVGLSPLAIDAALTNSAAKTLVATNVVAKETKNGNVLSSELKAAGESKLTTKSVDDLAAQANKANAQLTKEGQLVGDQPYVAPNNTTGGFQTHGVKTEQVPQAIQDQLTKDLRAGGAMNPRDAMQQIIESGKTVPIPMQASADTKLYKLVSPDGKFTTPSSSTAYWIDQKQLDLIKAYPERVNEILGLPVGSQAKSFNVFEIQPKPNTVPTIYQSQVATTTEANGLTSAGNATQTIVPNRNLWTTPKQLPIIIKVKK